MTQPRKRILSPRHKRMKRTGRLRAAKTWLARYSGKDIVKGYSNHFAVDKLCAVKELQMIGLSIDAVYIDRLKQSLEASVKAKAQRKQKELDEETWYEDADSWAENTSDGELENAIFS